MIEDILNGREGKTLEFKETLQSPQGIIKTIVAFANTAGGTIVIGVEDKSKKVVGIKDSLLQEERLASIITDSIAPLLVPDIEIVTFQNKELIIINVPHVAGPFFLKSAGLEKGAYVRIGSTNRVADAETLSVLKNLARNISFDEMPCVHEDPSAIDVKAIKKLFKEVHKSITINNLRSMGLLTTYGNKEVPTNGGIILFGVNRLKSFPEAIIRCARFAGIDKEVIIDQAYIDVYLPFALQEAINFIERNTALRSDIQGLVRKDVRQYPPIAIREVLTNAIVHADYAIKGVYISVAIFDDRIEITNPGALPFGFTLEKAMAGSSRIRNRVIAKVLYHLKWIEQWGRGLHLIMKECARYGLKEPLFQELNNQFRVTLYGEQKLKIVAKPWEKEMINYLKRKERVSTKEAATLWVVTTRSARLRLINLVDAGIIKRMGTSASDPLSSYMLLRDDLWCCKYVKCQSVRVLKKLFWYTDNSFRISYFLFYT